MEAIEIRLDILADRGHYQWAFAEQTQVVAYVSRSAAVLPPHLWREEAHVEDVKLVRQQVIPEAVRKYHDGVVGERARDQDLHEGERRYRRQQVASLRLA